MEPKYQNVYYGAYGSNLHMKQMLARCPWSCTRDSIALKDYRLVFRGVADIEPCKGSEVPIGLWRITDICEKALDRYEGFPNLYDKEIIDLPDFNGGSQVMVYRMVDQDTIYPPSSWYLDSLIQGYKDFGFDPEYLKNAVQDSFTRETA